MAFEILHPTENPKIKGVLFDMDGVVLDTEKLYARFWAEACAFYGYPMNYQQALGMRSLNKDAGQAYLSSLFGPEIRHRTIRDKRVELMDAYVEEHGVEAKAGIFELLDYLRFCSIPYAVTTASPLERISRYLGSLGLLERFDHICTAERVAHGKPEPDIYLLGAKTLGLPRKTVWPWRTATPAFSPPTGRSARQPSSQTWISRGKIFSPSAGAGPILSWT